jgi:uncharacterized protein
MGGIKMKRKKWTAFLTAFLLCLGTILGTISVQAAGSLPRLVDDAGLPSSSEAADLTKKLDEISEEYQCDVVVVTRDSLGGRNITSYADDYYDDNGYGYGSNKDGILFLISMSERKYWISTTGYAITVFTDAGLKYIKEQFQSDLNEGDYAKAFTTFADYCDRFLGQAASGEPYDVNNMPREPLSIIWLFVAILIGFVIAFLITWVMKNNLKSVRRQLRADSYVNKGSFRLTGQKDLFLYSQVHRTPKPKENSGGRGGGGGSSIHMGSSGSSHGGSGGSF